MTGQQSTIKVGNQRDWQAFKHLVKRSELGLKEPGVLAIERVSNDDEEIVCDHHWQDDDWDWHDCENPARVRLVRNRSYEFEEMEQTDTPADIYSDTFCIECLNRALSAWVDERLETIADALHEATA